MDIDHFKRINDCYGHLVGDECLKEVAQTIQDQLLRENDFLSRYGGEEFCVLLTNTPEDGAFQVAENIRLCVESLQVVKGGMTIPITISIGVATEIPVHKKNAETLLNRADEALYQSKSLGRNRVSIFEDEMTGRVESIMGVG
jgi:diguanylate cyclase (GGDEF)-like protein